MKNLHKGFIAPLFLVVILLVIGGGFYIYKNNKIEAPVVAGAEIQQIDKSEKLNNNLLSKNSFTNKKYGVTMYPPIDWYAKQDDYFNAQIMFLDKGQSTISDFATSNAIITLSVYPNDSIFSSTDKFIDETKKAMESTIELAKSADWTESSNPELRELNLKYSLFNKAISKKENVVVDGINGVAYDFGLYFGGSGFGRTIILEKDTKIFVIVAEVKDENIWMQNKDKIIQSMMSFRLVK